MNPCMARWLTPTIKLGFVIAPLVDGIPQDRGERPAKNLRERVLARMFILDGIVYEVLIDIGFCEDQYPCLVEAHYTAESAAAVAADRYLFP
jgi:hypothetical protein